MRTFVSTALATIAGLSLAATAMAQKSRQFDVDTAMTIPAGAPGTTFGVANPYPSSILVSGVSAPIGEVKVVLRGLTHSFMADLDILLVGPGGQSVLLANRVGGPNPGPNNATYVFTQNAVPMPVFAVPPSGRYAPTWAPGSLNSLNAPAPATPYSATLDVFKGQPANGFWSLYIQDRASSDTGSLAGWSLIIDEAPSYANPRSLLIPAGAPATTSGPASVYPTAVTVDGLEGSVRSLRVMVSGLNHSYQRDTRMVLQGPGGQTCMLYGNCGDSSDWANADLIFDDAGPSLPLSETALVPGTYHPTTATAFSFYLPNLVAPAPAGPYGSALAVFNGTNPNGEWKLWIEDPAGGDTGSLTGGWSLIINGQSCAADFNHNGGLDIQDIFDFLNGWFAGCP